MKKMTSYSFIFLMITSLFTSCGNGRQDEHAEHVRGKEQQLYTCPMHPQIIKNAPGNCPVCGMNLVKKESGNKVVQVELESLLKPANEFVVSTVPVTAIEHRQEDVELNVVGIVAHDTRRVGAISSRIKGRIEKLYIRYKYQPVRKGQRIMDIYSPELVTAQQNLIFLLKNDPTNTSLINSAEERLLFMGMTSGQIQDVRKSKNPSYSIGIVSNYSGFVTDINTLSDSRTADPMRVQTLANRALDVKEGMYIQSGQAVFSVYNPVTAWILLDIYPGQQSRVKTGNSVRIVPETAPDQSFSAKIDYLEPVFRPGTKTLSARVYINNAHMQLPIGSRVTATIVPSPITASWLPKDAVLSLGRDKVVFLKQQGGFKTRKVVTGMELEKSIQIVTGLSPRDSVAANAQFLVDNEAFIKASNK
jgi:membrane fusion protein, copper/silver efflux system